MTKPSFQLVNQPVSTGARPHHGFLVSDPKNNIALDYDFHVAGIVSSVCFIIDVPENSKDSFYSGTVHVTVKENVHIVITATQYRDSVHSERVSFER
jgi:hypothetical protein